MEENARESASMGGISRVMVDITKYNAARLFKGRRKSNSSLPTRTCLPVRAPRAGGRATHRQRWIEQRIAYRDKASRLKPTPLLHPFKRTEILSCRSTVSVDPFLQ